jgi:hypothetical protein
MLTQTRSMLEVDDSRAEFGEHGLNDLFRRTIKRAGQMRCGITGHNVLLKYEPKRLSLQCATCGYESPGWELTPKRAPVSYSGARFSPPVTV